MRNTCYSCLAALVMLMTAPAPAAEPSAKPLTAQTAVAFFIEAQDVAPFSSDEMAARAKLLNEEPEALAADNTLNLWKACVTESLARWALLNQGSGTLIDGAFGRCADLERDYRQYLTRMTPSGRQVVDAQLARTMTRSLEDAWRPRLTAAVLEQLLAKQQATAALTGPQPAREAAARAREERARPERVAPAIAAPASPRT